MSLRTILLATAADVLPWLQTLLAFGAFAIAIYTFRYNARVRRIEWIMKLYEKFFENEQFKEVRELVDADPDAVPEALVEAARRFEPKLIDFLNFFELIAHFRHQRMLSLDEIDTMFGYYLRKLQTVPCVRDIIDNDEMGFENLRRLVREANPR